MKKYLFVLMAVVMALTLMGAFTACSSSSSTSDEPVILRLSIPSPQGDPIVTNAERFANDFNAKAGGKYKIEIHPGESLVKFPDSLEALRAGSVEMDEFPIGAFSSVDPNFAAAELPFLVNSIQADAALQLKTLPLYDKIMTEKFNIKPVYSHTCLGLDIISKKQIKTQADMKGMLIQSISPQTAKFIELIGGSSVPISFTEAYESMDKGVIEASMQSASMMLQFSMQEVGDYVLKGYLTPACVAICINLDVYNKMPKDIQKLLMECGDAATKASNEFFVNVYNENYAKMAGVGLNVYSLPAAERAKWAEVLKPYCDELYAAMDPAFAKDLKAIGAELDKQFPYTE